MTYSIPSMLRASLPLSLAGLFAGLLASACDLPDKNLGDDADDASASSDGGTCEPGDTMMQDCNTCTCMDGQWACTEIGCEPDTGNDDDAACDPLQDPSDDCNECSCVAGEWACTDLGCGGSTGHIDFDCDPDEDQSNECIACECLASGQWLCSDSCAHPVELCEASDPTDPLTVDEAIVAGDTLTVSVSHGGGCAEHVYGSCWDGSFAESEPVQTWVQLTHEDNDDSCDAIVSTDVVIDLAPMRDAWIDAYQQPSGTIIVHVADWGSVDYSF